MAVVCLPFDRGVLSTPTNLGWFLAIWLSLVSVMRLPREPWRVAVLAAAGSCVVFSTPLAPINLPLWLLRGVRGSVRGDRRELSFALVLIAALAGVVLFTHGMGSTASVTILGMGAVRITFRSWANLASFRLATLVLPSTTPVVAGQPQMILTAHLPLAYLVASLVTVGLRASLAQPPPSTGDCRPLFGVPGGDARPRTRRGSRRPAARTRAKRIDARGDRASGAGWSPSFVSPPFQDLHWARYAPSIERTLRDRCPVQLTVPMNPPFAPLRIAWGALHPEKPVPPERIVRTVTPEAPFEQSFTSGCDRLTEVDLYLGTLTSSAPQALALTILDGTASIASATLAPTDPGTSGWQSFCFPPIDEAAGRRLTLVLHATSADRNARVVVFGGRSGEASLRHGCAA